MSDMLGKADRRIFYNFIIYGRLLMASVFRQR